MGIAFSPDGTRLVTASNDGTARVYLLNIEELIALAKSRVTRSLTTEECQQYLHVEVLNDYSYRQDPAKAKDSRWAHRPRTDWSKLERRGEIDTIEGRIFQGLQRLIRLRKQTAAFSGCQLQVMNTGNPHVLGYVRTRGQNSVLVFANFTESEQLLNANLLRLYGLSYQFTDLISGESHPLKDQVLPPFGFVCLAGTHVTQDS